MMRIERQLQEPSRRLKATALAALAMSLACGLSQAQFPIQSMGLERLGLGYNLMAAGQNITRQNVPSQQLAHQLAVGYAPIPYAGLILGLGMARFETEPSNTAGAFRGKYGFSPSATLQLATPAWLRGVLRVTADVSLQYLSSDDKQNLNYNAMVVDPAFGLQLSPLGFLDLRLGGRYHIVNGHIDLPRSNASSTFSNGTSGRGYFGFLVKTPAEGAFFAVDLDFSPDTDANWSHGPVEATVRATVGTVLGWRSREPKVVPRNPYFPNYKELKDRQEQMSDELQSD